MTEHELLGLTEAARIAGLRPVSLRRAARIGTLHAVRVGARSYAVTRGDLAAYMAYTAQRGWLIGRPPPKRKRKRPTGA